LGKDLALANLCFGLCLNQIPKQRFDFGKSLFRALPESNPETKICQSQIFARMIKKIDFRITTINQINHNKFKNMFNLIFFNFCW
jgi:hypothetical protein